MANALHTEPIDPARKIIPINEGWEFRQAGPKYKEFLPVAQFPTNVHLDLIAHNLIPDPYHGKNERDVQWVGEKSWIYRTTFQAESPEADRKAVLVFDGLDTYATVSLNGTEILKTENMFVPERVDISRLLGVDGKNEISITFESTYLKGKKIVENHPEHHWGCWNGDPSRLAVRKAQYHYGWDWGPTLLTCGPWRPINLEVYYARIADLYFTTDVDESLNSAEIIANADIEGLFANWVKFEISLHGSVISTETVLVKEGFATATFVTQNPELWYPARYGRQPLYTLKATAGFDWDDIVTDTTSKRFGLRRAKVVQREVDDAPGSCFFFEINNIPVLCGGSNWIPADNFIPRINASRYRDWVKLAVEGNQAMIRVWGGGIYEEQAFYDTCDEMGVLIWQDFLFGCGNYPAYNEFLESVRREAVANLKILRHHPCIVLWAGNNEDYQYAESEGLDYDPTDTDPQNWLKTSFPARYIYEKLLVDVTKELVPDTYYHYGSPWGGKSTTDATVGDIHQWNVWHGTQEKYQDLDLLSGRFVSEFGMEALPHMKTIDSFLPTDSPDRYAQSSTLSFHNKAAGHSRRLALYLAENIPYTLAPLSQYIYHTQLLQAECVATAYRLWKRQWKGPGKEYCAGALVWQLNDVWPGISWSIADHHLRPKHAYYAIKRELEPLTIGMKRTTHSVPRDKYTRAYMITTHKISFWAVNLSLQPRTVHVHAKAWHIPTTRETLTGILAHDLVLRPNQSTEICEMEVPVLNKDADEESQTVVAAWLIDASVEKGGRWFVRAVNWPEPLRYVHFQQPKDLRIEVSEDGNEDGLVVSADVPVKGLALESPDEAVVFEDNCVDLVPGEKVTVGVKGLKKGDEGKVGIRYLGMKSPPD
ncbi:MAG: hypothetical protein M1827_006171 [Pycnora praestabilis]|nr:MAG: hypothetical protein M1827_006171 [Pycnora praestabilis]